MTDLISDPEGFFVAIVCSVVGWCFGFFFHRKVLGGGNILADWQFGWCVFMPCLLFLVIRFTEAAMFRHHILVDGSWTLAWITPLTVSSMIGYRSGKSNPSPLSTLSCGFALNEDDHLFLVRQEHEQTLQGDR